MNEQTEKLIRELADKLGTTSEHLWSVLVAQAPIDSASVVLMLAAFLLAGGLLAANHYNKPWFKNDESYTCITVMNPTVPMFAFILGCAVFVITAIVLATELPMILAGFFNPEFWALKQILK